MQIECCAARRERVENWRVAVVGRSLDRPEHVNRFIYCLLIPDVSARLRQ